MTKMLYALRTGRRQNGDAVWSCSVCREDADIRTCVACGTIEHVLECGCVAEPTRIQVDGEVVGDPSINASLESPYLDVCEDCADEY